MAQLSPAAIRRGRQSFHLFNTFNSLSFVLLSGSFITLYALSLGASKATVGLLNAFGYVTFFFLPLGKRFAREKPIVKVFGWAWFWRFVGVAPALLAPLFVARGLPGLGFGCILMGVALFNVFRGIGLVGNNPVLANLADGGAGFKRADRGAFLLNVNIVANIAGLVSNLAVALVIGPTAPAWAFATAMGVGIALGVVGSVILLKRVPEPEGYRPDKSGSLVVSAREAFKEKGFRAFMEALFLLAFVSGMARSFLPVYAKEVYLQGDDMVMVYALVSSLGSIAMGLFARLLVDRLGAKPLYVVFAAVTAISLLPLVLAPGPIGPLASPAFVIVLLSLVNFLASFGISGEENVGQTYFFSLVSPERTLDLGVVYFLVYGLGGTLGAGAGGLVLDRLEAFGLAPAAAYRVFFGSLIAIVLWVILRSPRLVRLGSASVRESISVIFSIRDLRAFNLLSRLDKTEDPVEEIALIRGIGSEASGGGSHQAQMGLLAYLGSPRLEVRLEALLAIENMGELGDEAVAALAAEVERQPYTTAYLAARVLGKSCTEPKRVLPVLRTAASAEDYMLQASAMVALAKLGDKKSAGLIEDALASSRIPRVRISAAYALEILGNKASVPALIACLRRERDPAFVSDELLLSTASIVGIMPSFYGPYQAFLEDEGAGAAALRDIADGALGAGGVSQAGDRERYELALAAILSEPSEGAAMSTLILERGADAAGSAWPVDIVLAEAALDPSSGYRGLRFLVAAYCLLRR
jgi:HEAT repeat protein